MKKDRLITLAIHTYPKALILKGVLESQGIAVVIQNVNLLKPVISPGVRVRIHEKDLPHALEILETDPVFGKSEVRFTQSRGELVAACNSYCDSYTDQ